MIVIQISRDNVRGVLYEEEENITRSSSRKEASRRGEKDEQEDEEEKKEKGDLYVSWKHILYNMGDVVWKTET